MATVKELNIPKTTRLVAVSKLQSVEKIKSLYEQGQRIFAENYVQEALPKIIELKNLEIEWHFIGSLQRNKAKLVVGEFALIQSVDSLKLAETISDLAQKKQIQQKILLQVNLADETTKSGFSTQEIRPAAEKIAKLPGVLIVGLMCMPPLFEEAEKVRPFFRQLAQIRNELQKLIPSITELSMGTSSDYQIAISEGATLVRLGTILFGERPQKK